MLAVGGLAIAAGALGWLLFVAMPRWYGPTERAVAAAPPPATPAVPGRKIKARLYYVSEDGTALTALERDVPFAENAAEQAREIVAAQMAPVAEPLVSAVPPGAVVRSVFISANGEAYVDISHEIVSAHTGGTLDEILTVYALVNALTSNLPAVASVQLLVDGKEVATLAGHVDLRRPLAKNLAWVQ